MRSSLIKYHHFQSYREDSVTFDQQRSFILVSVRNPFTTLSLNGESTGWLIAKATCLHVYNVYTHSH